MADAFASVRMEHSIKNGRLFTRGTESFDGVVHWTIEEVGMNFQHRIVGNIASGVTIDEVFFPPPPTLIAAIRDTEQYFGPFPRRDETGRRIYGGDPRFESCTLMRAAILKDP